jgi:hypothetical protein
MTSADIQFLRLQRTILLLHIISERPSKQPLMVRTLLVTFLKVESVLFIGTQFSTLYTNIYMELGSYFLFLQEQKKDIIIEKCNLGLW